MKEYIIKLLTSGTGLSSKRLVGVVAWINLFISIIILYTS